MHLWSPGRRSGKTKTDVTFRARYGAVSCVEIVVAGQRPALSSTSMVELMRRPGRALHSI
jgi:hypothetical protein